MSDRSPSVDRPKSLSRRPPTARVAILSRRRGLYSTRRLLEALRLRGHRAQLVDVTACDLLLSPQPGLEVRGVPLVGLTLAIPRIGASVTQRGLAVVRQLEAMGVRVLASSEGIALSRDKLGCLQRLAGARLPMPRTVFAREGATAKSLISAVGGLPAIVKLLRGTQGRGVMLASSVAELQGLLETFRGLGHPVVLQEWIRDSAGSDLRALVIGDRVVGAMRRQARGNEFRSNLHRGGRGTALRLDGAAQEIAVRAARVAGLEVAGVDLLESADGPKVLELNSSPGLEGLERATGLDLAGAVVDHALATVGASGPNADD